MICPACGYAMDAFDKECARCHGKGTAADATAPPANATAPKAVDAPVAVSPSAGMKFADADADAIERLCGIGFLAGLAIAFYFFLFFDVSVEVPTTDFIGTTIGGGRVNNIGLMAQRQNGILFGFGLAIICAVVYMVLQNQRKQA